MKILNKSLLIIGVLHIILGFVFYWEELKNIAGSQIIDSIEGYSDRSEAFWYFITGIMVITCGLLIQYSIRETKKPIPAAVGVTLSLMSIIGIVLMPASGFWLFLPQAFFILYSGKKRKNLLRKYSHFQ